jgi:hypothetical protein
MLKNRAGRSSALSPQAPWKVVTLMVFCFAASARAGNQRALTELEPSIVCAGHIDEIRATAIFPNGKRMVSASNDATARLWDLDTGECLHTFAGHDGAVRAIAVSRDAKWIATASDDSTARIWDVATGDQLFQFEGHARTVRGVEFLPDGKLLSVGGEGKLRLWNIENEQQLWESAAEDTGTCMAVTPDGRRAVYGGRDGVAHGWDLVSRKKLADYGEACGCNVTTVAISPDGQTVYVAVADRSASAYRADTAVKLPSDKGIFDPGAMGLSPDGKIIASFHHVNDAQTGLRLFTLKPHGLKRETCYTFSADNRTLAVGRANYISVFRFPDPDAAQPLGRAAGSISWDVIPTKVRTLGGMDVPLEETHGYRGFYLWKTTSIPAGENRQTSIDVLATQDRVVMQREEGILQEILYQRNVDYCAVAWDGVHLWIAAADGRIFGCTPDGVVEVTLNAEQGLPPTSSGLLLYPLDRDRVLVAGADDNDGWCALIHRDAASDKAFVYRIKVIVDGHTLPAGWNDSFPNPSPKSTAPLHPLFFTEPPATAQRPRLIMLCCSPVPRSSTPILCIDANSLAVTAYNLAPQPSDPSHFQRTAHTPANLLEDRDPQWLSPQRLFCRSLNGYSVELKYEGGMFDAADATSFGHTPTKQSALSQNGNWYLPGSKWFRIDPMAQNLVDLGPGLRVDGTLVERDLTYYVSPRWGLSAMDTLCGRIYRFSTDTANPKSIHGTLDFRPSDPPIYPDGRVTYGPSRASFACKTGTLTFVTNTLTIDPPATPARLQAETRVGITFAEVKEIGRRATGSAAETKRLALSDAQTAQLQKLAPSWTKPDSKKLQQLYRQFQKAELGEARKAAARPILDEAANLGEKWSADAEAYLRAFRAVFTDRQWNLIQTSGS